MRNIVDFVTRLLKMKRASTALILITSLISAIIIFITFYASQVGNFIITAANDEYMLLMCETEDFLEPVSVLAAKSVTGLDNTTLSRIDVDMIRGINGSANSFTYLAYSFYLRNYSGEMVDYNMRLGIESVYKNVDQAIWILVIEERGDDIIQTIYAMRQTAGANIGEPEDCLPGITPVPFLSAATVFDYNVKNFRDQETARYTVIMWLEGEDPQCVDEIRSGSIKMSMKFTPYVP